MAIHHLRKWSLKYKVREELKSYNKTLRSLFCPAIIFWMMMRPSITLTKNLEWLSTYSLQVDFGFFKIRIRLVNRKKSVFWLSNEAWRGFSDISWSWFLMFCGVWWTESLVLWHVCQRMFVSKILDNSSSSPVQVSSSFFAFLSLGGISH